MHIIGTAAIFPAIPISPANALDLKLNPSSISLAAVNISVSISVVIGNVSNLGAFDLKIAYDPTIVTVENNSDVALGDFLGSTGRTTGTLGPKIDNGAGRVSFGAYSLGEDPGPNGEGVLCTIVFSIKEKYSGILVLLDTKIVDTEGEILKVDEIGNSILFNEIYVDPENECGGKSPCRDTINKGISGAASGSIIKIAEGAYNENPVLTSSKILILQGGWNRSFTSQTPRTTFIKSPQITTGSVTFQNLVVKP